MKMLKGRVQLRDGLPISGGPLVDVVVANIDDSVRVLTVGVTIDTGFSAHLPLPSAVE